MIENHLNYFDIYTNEAASFVKSMLNAAPRTSCQTSTPVASTTVSVSTSISVPSNGSVILVPTYTLRPTTAPLVTYVPESMTSVKPDGAVVIATLITDASKTTSVPVIPSATGTVAVTVIEAPVPTDVLTSITASGVASGTGSPAASGTTVTFDPANGAMSVSAGVTSAVAGLLVAAFMAVM